jgi:hypothetical protein
MTEYCECNLQESNKITQMCLSSDILRMNLFYHSIYNTDMCALHVLVLRNFPNFWFQKSGHIGDDEKELATYETAFSSSLTALLL